MLLFIKIDSCVSYMQKEQVYIMDASAVSNICNGTFYDNKVLTKVSNQFVCGYSCVQS